MQKYESSHDIAAIILAAGLSRRMGSPKMLLPWRGKTVIEQAVNHIIQAGVKTIYVITGGARNEVEAVLKNSPALTIYNPEYENGEMLTSFQCGVQQIKPEIKAILLALGDQPEIPSVVIQGVIQEFEKESGRIIIPSFNQRRGHPWLIDRKYLQELMDLNPPQTLRDFLNHHERDIRYLNVTTSTILQDLDTPEDYQRQHTQGQQD